eukprot:1161076-Pelagomonas_calceolata.AAC.8
MPLLWQPPLSGSLIVGVQQCQFAAVALCTYKALRGCNRVCVDTSQVAVRLARGESAADVSCIVQMMMLASLLAGKVQRCL